MIWTKKYRRGEEYWNGGRKEMEEGRIGRKKELLLQEGNRQFDPTRVRN